VRNACGVYGVPAETARIDRELREPVNKRLDYLQQTLHDAGVKETPELIRLLRKTGDAEDALEFVAQLREAAPR
jgi:hypothetical protein